MSNSILLYDEDEDAETYEDYVQDVDLDELLKEPATRRALPPRVSDAEDFLRDREAEAHEERRIARTEGRPYQVPDARGVRGQQFAQVPDIDTQLALLRQGQDSILSPYYSESGIKPGQRLLSTSWVDDVRFDITLSSKGPSIHVPLAEATRQVSPADEFIQGTFKPNGVPDNGGEYAVFGYELAANEFIRSAPSQALRIDLTARFTHGDTTVVKDLRASALGLVLDMKEVHPILMSNSDNGRPVTTKSGIVVRKTGEQLPFAPAASIFKRPARFTFRYRPSERSWMLTRVDFAVRRYQLQDIPDSKATLYFNPTWRVSGEPLDQRLVSLVQVEDPASNPLDPMLFLEVFPLRSETNVSGLPVLAGQPHRVTISVTSQLVPRKNVNQTGRAARTLYTDLPSLDVTLPDAAEIIRQSPKFGIEAFRVRIPRPDKDPRSQFTSSELSLHNAGVSALIMPSVENESVYDIVSLQIGPIRQSALYEAIADAEARI